MKRPKIPDVSGSEYEYLGHFRKDRFLREGHNTHETSETVQDEQGNWVNVYGQGVKNRSSMEKIGQRLPGEPTYKTEREAVEGAIARSEGFPSFQEGVYGVTLSDQLRSMDPAQSKRRKR